MHPRIEKLYNEIKFVSEPNILNNEVLYLLKGCGATRTEAAITLHVGFNINSEKADRFVINSNIWQNEEIDDVFYQTMKYLYYNPEDPNYEEDDDRIQISI